MPAANDVSGDWWVAVGLEFLRCGLSACARDVMIALCVRCRDKSYTWASTRDLMALTGRGRTSVMLGLAELEAGGWAWRSMAPRRRTMRTGIVLRRRPDARFWPQADDDDKLAAAILALSADRKAWEGRRRRHAGIAAPN